MVNTFVAVLRRPSIGIGAGVLMVLAVPSAQAAGTLSPMQEVIERSEVINTLSTVLVAFDNKAYDRFIAAFMPDGKFIVVDPDPKRNLTIPKAELAKEFGRLPSAAGDLRHYTSNLSVVFADATHARLHGYYVLMNRNTGKPMGPPPAAAGSAPADNAAAGGPPGAGGMPMGMVTVVEMGSYDSKLVKVNGKWMFETYHIFHAGTGASPL